MSTPHPAEQRPPGHERPPERGRPLGRERLERATGLVRWLDDRYLDPLIGLVFPGMGDVLTSTAGLYLVVLAAYEGLPPVVMARMLINLALDTAMGVIPVLGDVFDVFYKANKRNLALLEARHATRRATTGDWLVVGAAGVVFLIALSLPVLLVVLLLSALF